MRRAVHPVTEKIRNHLRESANLIDARHMQAYMKSEMPFRGVRAAQQQKIFTSAFREYSCDDYASYRQAVNELWDAEYREERYASIAAARKYNQFIVMKSLPVYEMMIRTGAWWDYVDAIAKHLIGLLLKNYPNEMRIVLNEWIVDDDLWIRRSAILSQLAFKHNTDKNLLFEFCSACAAEESFWIRKAIGWALREYSKSEPIEVANYIEGNKKRLSNLSIKEGSKYLRNRQL